MGLVDALNRTAEALENKAKVIVEYMPEDDLKKGAVNYGNKR